MMTQATLTEELQELDTNIIVLGTQVHDALKKELLALETSNAILANDVIAADVQQDTLRSTIEEHALRLLSWHEPLSEPTVRYLLSSLMIVGELERVGDGAAGIAKMQLRMAGTAGICKERDPLASSGYVSGSASILHSLLDLGQEALRVLRNTKQAFAERNLERARQLWQEDDVVDVRYHMVRHDLMQILTGNQAITALQSDPDSLLRATYFLWIAHKLERVADHCTNICERLTYIIEGKQTIPDLSTPSLYFEE